MAEDIITSYGIIAVKFINGTTKDKKHHHFISHVFMIKESDSSFYPQGKLYTKDEAIKILTVDKIPLHTLTWDYSEASWKQGANIDTEEKDKITYLRSHRNKVVSDNLKNLLDYKYFV